MFCLQIWLFSQSVSLWTARSAEVKEIFKEKDSHTKLVNQKRIVQIVFKSTLKGSKNVFQAITNARKLNLVRICDSTWPSGWIWQATKFKWREECRLIKTLWLYSSYQGKSDFQRFELYVLHSKFIQRSYVPTFSTYQSK